MATIFIAISYGGEYDDAWEHNLAVSADKELLEAFIESNKQDNAKYNELVRIAQEFYNKWSLENPMPICQPLHDVPKWPAGIAQSAITVEMQKERDSIKAKNAWIKQNHGDIWTARAKAYDLAESTMFYEIGCVPDDLHGTDRGANLYMNYADRHYLHIGYKIEELPVLEVLK